MIRWLANQLDRLVNKLAPPIPDYYFQDAAEWLADFEEDHDSLLPDELWAAHRRAGLPGNPPSPDVVPAPPADAKQPAQALGVGGHLKRLFRK